MQQQKQQQRQQMTLTKKLTTTIPPKSGPVPQGLNLNYNTVKTVKLEKTNGRHRQGSTKRAKKNS